MDEALRMRPERRIPNLSITDIQLKKVSCSNIAQVEG